MIAAVFNRNSRRQSAFTLIELLVVIAIIAILAAMLFPSFARAREGARRASCQSNERQMGLGIQQYTQDYDERYPRNDGGGELSTWIDTIQPYIKSDQIFICPSDSNPFTPTIAGNQGRKSSYSINQIYYTVPGIAIFEANVNGVTPMTLAGMEDSSGTILVGDSLGYYQNFPVETEAATGTVPFYSSDSQPSFGDKGLRGAFVARHLSGTNFLFADGHVKWLRLDTVVKKNAANRYPFFTPALD